ncbi:MAG: peptide-methionine (S)-S-oxide reductase MsrA [Candidatus Lokiarchaeota archaeon]|nr:peptide-methionine (S)-S-oxide reductase MsrA [Candidatus Lokiarchaeota archaeon]
MKKATLGGGCFWCTEAVFQRLKGVHSVTSGYAGGDVANPTYQEVCSGNTGHAEVVQIEYDPEVISYEELLDVFFETHDPTTLNRQGNDVGTQYRSIILYHDEQQKTAAIQKKNELDQRDKYESPIVTQISKLDDFYPAEEYHQDYYEKNSGHGYCRIVIEPKLEKVEQTFSLKLSE